MALLEAKRVECIYFSDLQSLHRVSKLAVIVIISCFFSFAGIPPFIGFYTKFFLLIDLFSNQVYWSVFLILGSSLVSVFYYVRIVKLLIFAKADNAGGSGVISLLDGLNIVLFLILFVLVSFPFISSIMLQFFSTVVAIVVSSGGCVNFV
jgi:NADH-quinone oxidoreductase subunit N